MYFIDNVKFIIKLYISDMMCDRVLLLSLLVISSNLLKTETEKNQTLIFCHVPVKK